jgi:hypothetical protein
MQREREKKERAAAKRERRQERSASSPEEVTSDIPLGEELSAADLMRHVEAIHSDSEAGRIDRDTFEEKKAELLARVRID